MIYWICGLCFQVIESIVELAFKYESLFSAYQRTISNVQLPRFAVVQMRLGLCPAGAGRSPGSPHVR